MTIFESALDYLFEDEGTEYVDDPDDRGGPTKFGVTLKTYSEYLKRPVTPQEIQDLTVQAVGPFYEDTFWLPMRCDKMRAPAIAIALFDCSVLFGIHGATVLAQQALNACGAGVKADGVMGFQTLQALNLGGAPRFIRFLNGVIMQRIDVIIENNPTQEKFRHDWTNRADRLLTLI